MDEKTTTSLLTTTKQSMWTVESAVYFTSAHLTVAWNMRLTLSMEPPVHCTWFKLFSASGQSFYPTLYKADSDCWDNLLSWRSSEIGSLRGAYLTI